MKTQEEVAPLNMQVPERILVAGGNSHVAAKNLPRELQLESSVLSPSPEQVSHHCYIKIPRYLESLHWMTIQSIFIDFRSVYLHLQGQYG